MSTSFLWNVVQKYPGYKVLNQDHPCFCNVTEVYNYKRDGNYNGLLRNVNFYSNGDGRKLDIKPAKEPQAVSKSHKSELKVLITPIVLPEPMPSVLKQTESPCPIEPDVQDDEKQEVADIETKPQRKQRFNGDELLNLEDEEYCDLLEDFIPFLDLSIMAGKGGVGKTMLYLELSLRIVTGKESFLERRISSRNKSVLIIATEDNERRLQSRIKKQIKRVDPEVKSLKNLIIVTTGLDLVNSIRKELSAKQFDLVVIDALGDVLDGDQNSSVEIRKFFSEFQNLISEFGTTFLFVTHEGKSAGRDRRTNILGSVSIVDRVRSAFTLYNDDKTGLKALSILKSNNIPAEKIGKPTYLELDNETLTFSVVQNPKINVDATKTKRSNITSGAGSRAKYRQDRPGRKIDNAKWLKCREMVRAGKKQCDIATELEISKGTVSRWVKGINRPLPPYDTSIVGDVG